MKNSIPYIDGVHGSNSKPKYSHWFIAVIIIVILLTMLWIFEIIYLHGGIGKIPAISRALPRQTPLTSYDTKLDTTRSDNGNSSDKKGLIASVLNVDNEHLDGFENTYVCLGWLPLFCMLAYAGAPYIRETLHSPEAPTDKRQLINAN